jgi:hypothetical protein
VLGVLTLFSWTSIIVVILFTNEHRYKMSSRTSTVYKYVKEHYPVSKEYRGAGEHQVENPGDVCCKLTGQIF